MDKRQSERVQFFRIEGAMDMPLVWIFRRTSPDALLGLLVDIGDGGIQVLTSKIAPVVGDLFQLTVHLENDSKAEVIVNRVWSKKEGTLYFRSGFNFDDEEENAVSSVNKVLNERAAGNRWLRCELLGLSVKESAKLDHELAPG